MKRTNTSHVNKSARSQGKNPTETTIPSIALTRGKATQLIPLEVIRTENVISKFPVHNLAKTGRVNIRLTRKRDDGEIDYYWEVSPNEKYGEPKQLAYQVDTLIIAKRVYDYYENGESIPEIIPIGSLYQICRELGMNPRSGKNKNNIKHALGQNAGALIDAIISFKDREGRERRESAQFTRYTVIHRNQKLKDGHKADQFYIMLHPFYLEVLNSARWRPLDFKYLKELPPAAQRCYEIISTRIFAAIKYGHSRAEIMYSDYCAFSAQIRQLKYKSFRAQMDHVHKPHLLSGYLAKVDYEETLDTEGQVDWLIGYYPGPKARAEFYHFNPRFGDAAEIEGINSDSRAGAGQGSEPRKLVEYFHQLVHKAGRECEPSKKELEQASALIDRHGVDVARYIVEFAHKEAPKTKFAMQVFGAVKVYEKRGLAAYMKWKANQKGQGSESKAEIAKTISEFEAIDLAGRAYDQLSEAERHKRSIQIRSRLEANKNLDTSDWDEESWAIIVKKVVISELAEEIRLGQKS